MSCSTPDGPFLVKLWIEELFLCEDDPVKWWWWCDGPLEFLAAAVEAADAAEDAADAAADEMPEVKELIIEDAEWWEEEEEGPAKDEIRSMIR